MITRAFTTLLAAGIAATIGVLLPVGAIGAAIELLHRVFVR
jgi:hypothetical protein